MAQRSKKDIVFNTPIVGLNKDSHPSRVEQGEYFHANNTNISTKDGMEFFLTSEPSNLLVTRIKEGYKVLGFEANYNKGYIYYFLHNPETKVSEIGRVRIITDKLDLEDNYQYSELENTEKELADIMQQPYVKYETIIEDSCNGCLGFKIDRPIKSIIVRQNDHGDLVTWTFVGGEPMTLDMSKLDELLYTGYEGCTENSKEPTCLDCDKLRVFPRFSIANLTPISTTTDGSLSRGTYEFYMAYCTVNGVELTEYFSQTSKVGIFDATDNNLPSDDISGRTRYGIKLGVTGLDRRFKHFKIVVGYTSQSGTRYYEEGIYDIDVDSVVIDRDPTTYSREADPQTVRGNKTPLYRTSERVVELSGMLLHINTKQEQEWNLQPVVNLMGAFAEWATVEVEEGFYRNPLPSSLMKSRMRDEVYAEGIRFHTKSGYTTVDMPLISRPAREWEMEVVSENRPDVQSIRSGYGQYSEETRDRVWQFENTAGEGEYFPNYVHSNKRTTESVDVYTTTTDPVDTIPDPSTQTGTVGGVPLPFDFTINTEAFGEYFSVKDFIEENYDRIINYISPTNPTESDKTIMYLKGILTRQHTGYLPDDIDISEFGQDGDCSGDEPIGTCCGDVAEDLDGKRLVLGEVENENTTSEYYSVSDYSNIPSPDNCFVVEKDSEGNPVNSPLDQYTYRHSGINKRRSSSYVRVSGGTTHQYSSAQEIFNYDPQEGNMLIGYFLDYDYSIPDDFGEGDIEPADCPTDLLNPMYSNLSVDTSGLPMDEGRMYSPNMTNKAAWFKVDVSNREQVVLHVSPFNMEDARRTVFTLTKTYRISIFNNGTDSAPVYSKIFSTDSPQKIGIDLTGELGIDYGYLDLSSELNGDEFFVVIDSGIRSMERDGMDFCWIDSPEGCFSIAISDTRTKRAIITFDPIDLRLNQRFTAICSYEVPELFRGSMNYKKGEFAYVESTETYPNNKELYDSSWLNIRRRDIPDRIRQKFEEFYTIDGNTIGGRYVLKDVDFTCQKIRHFKYPNNTVAPIMPSYRVASMSDTVIYPIGIYLDKTVIESFLDIALYNGLITREQREDIESYELLVGDRTGNKTVLAKGIGFDMYKYDEDRDILFSNFPFNSLGDIELFEDRQGRQLRHPTNSQRNSMFTISTPSTYMSWNEKPTEITLDGYMLGDSENKVTETKDHAKWVVLGARARQLATLLASTEVTMEILLDSLSGLETARFSVGLVVEMNPAGLVANIANVAMAITNSAGKIARYRYQWLETFENIGKPVNFAYRVSGVGKYTSMITQIDTSDSYNYLRGLKASKKLEPTTEIVTNVDGDRTYINNINREESIYVELAKDVEYVSRYSRYDNVSVNRGTASRFIQSQTGQEEDSTVIRRVASPYFALKNYLPSQYGRINNIVFYTNGQIRTFDAKQEVSFGGDIYIGRFADIRKAEIFSQNAMGIPDRTPFEYSRYPRYGNRVRYYLNHKINDQTGIKSRIVPDIVNKYNLDNARSTGGMYIKEPAKFYTHYHGIVNYIVESEYNPNYRYSIRGDDTTVFFPQNSDYKIITEPTHFPLTEKAQFLYSNIYSWNPSDSTGARHGETYNTRDQEIKASGENFIVASKPQIVEDRLMDPWKIYSAHDNIQTSKNSGRLLSAIKLESEQLLLLFENNMSILNAQADQREGEYTRLVSSLNTRPIEFTRSSVGYGGGEETSYIQTDLGTVKVDTKRGDIFLINSRPGSMPELTNLAQNYGDNPTKMGRWFQRNLPFKIKTSKIEKYEDINLDNNFNGVGISIGYDNTFKRLFLTKKDFVPLRDDIVYDGGGFYDKSDVAIQNLISEKEAEGYTYVSRDGGRLIFTKESDDTHVDCLSNIKFVVEYRATSGESPCAGGHVCNRAVFDLVINGVVVGQVNMNNAGGEYDNQNRPDDYTSANDRYSEVTLTNEQVLEILEISHLLDISLECACIAGVNCQSAQCHNSVSWLRLEVDGDVIYSGCPVGGFLQDYDACREYTDITIISEEFYLPKLELDSEAFEDASWTITFDFRFGRWISYFDFKPNFIISLPEYIMTGYNFREPEIYIHGMTNRSYQNFGGKQYPWVVDVPGEHTVFEDRIESIMYMMEAYRHDSEYYGNYIINPRVAMDEAIIYGTSNNSGVLRLDQKDTVFQGMSYPIQVNEYTQAILQTLVGGLWSFNYFYNRMKEGHKMWTTRLNGYERDLVIPSLDYNKGPVLERMDGNNFAVQYLSRDSKHEKNFRINLVKVNKQVR